MGWTTEEAVVIAPTLWAGMYCYLSAEWAVYLRTAAYRDRRHACFKLISVVIKIGLNRYEGESSFVDKDSPRCRVPCSGSCLSDSSVMVVVVVSIAGINSSIPGGMCYGL